MLMTSLSQNVDGTVEACVNVVRDAAGKLALGTSEPCHSLSKTRLTRPWQYKDRLCQRQTVYIQLQ